MALKVKFILVELHKKLSGHTKLSALSSSLIWSDGRLDLLTPLEDMK